VNVSDPSPALKRAILTLRSRVEESPKDTASALALAEALFRLAAHTADAARQVEYLARACQLDPYDARLRIALGRARIRAGEVREGVESIVAAAALRPKDPGPWIALGNALLGHYQSVPEAKTKFVDRAIEAYDKALALDPSIHTLHVAKLHAAACARLAGRPAKLLPAAVQAIPIAPELAPAMTWLGTSLAYALHYPKHFSSRNAQERLSPEERKTRTKVFATLRDSIAPWIAALPNAASLEMVKAAIEILDATLPDSEEGLAAACDAFARCVVAAAPRFTDRTLLHLVVHQKLEEIGEINVRIAVMRELLKHLPLAVGIDREVFTALNAGARAALLDGKPGEARRLWHDGLAIDPYCAAFHHNLALLALHERDAARLAVHLQAAVDLQVSQWCLGGDRTDTLERLAAHHASFAARLEKTVSAELARGEINITADLLAAWIGETQTALVMRALLGAIRRGVVIDAPLRQAVAAYLRDLPIIGDPAGRPPAPLAALLDPVTKKALLLYDAIDVAFDASAAEIAKATETALTNAAQGMAEALARGDREAVADAQRYFTRVNEAKDTLQDDAKRAAYDRECMSPVEHAYNRARHRFVMDLAKHVKMLSAKKKHELVLLLVRAYKSVPHDRIDDYFVHGVRDGVRDHMLVSALQLPYLDELFEQERWDEAFGVADAGITFLEGWRTMEGDARPHVLYFLARCEYRREISYVNKNGVFTAAGVSVSTRARERLAALGGPQE
jgi:tetratricopeptide (TPR) repeat protein